MRSLSALLIILYSASAWAQSDGSNPIIISAANDGNFGSWNGDVGPYWSSINLWDPPTDGSSYSTSITNYPSTYPNGTVMNWSFPNYFNGSTNVYAYPDIVYGILGGGFPPTPKNIPAPLQLSSIPSDFTLTFNVTLNANFEDQDLLIETWPTTVSNPQNPYVVDTRTEEVGVFAHTPSNTMSGILNVPDHWNFSQNGFNAYIAKWYTGGIPFVMIAPVSAPGGTTPIDMADGATHTIPWGDLIGFMVSNGVLDGTNYLTGFEFGFEIGRGSGSAQINLLEWQWN